MFKYNMDSKGIPYFTYLCYIFILHSYNATFFQSKKEKNNKIKSIIYE